MNLTKILLIIVFLGVLAGCKGAQPVPSGGTKPLMPPPVVYESTVEP